jgi:hypothetical protein
MQPLNTLSASTIMDLLWAGKQDDARKLVTAKIAWLKNSIAESMRALEEWERMLPPSQEKREHIILPQFQNPLDIESDEDERIDKDAPKLSILEKRTRLKHVLAYAEDMFKGKQFFTTEDLAKSLREIGFANTAIAG